MSHYAETKRWTYDQTEVVRAMAAEGHTAASIGAALDRNRNSIIGYAHRAGIKLGNRPSRAQLDLPPPIDRRIKRRPVVAYVIPPKPVYEKNHYRGVRPVDATPKQCRWGLGNLDPRHSDFLYCGLPIVGKSSWCASHYAVAFTCTNPTITSYPN